MSITDNFALIEGAQLSNSFIILMTLDKAEESLLTSSDISKIISYNSLGHIYKPASTLKDSLENHLKREGYIEGIVENNKTYYKITPKGKKLLKGWISFLTAYKND
jgi:DNA-binding PadR family transcriptional regulator